MSRVHRYGYAAFGDPSTPPRNPAAKGRPPENEFGQVVNALASDAAGNTVVVGTFYGNIPFVDGVRSATGRKGFAVRYDANGNQQSSRVVGSGTTDSDATTVAMKDTGEAIIGGTFLGALDGYGVTANTSSSRDVYFAKWDSDMHLVWAKKVWGTATMSVAGLDFDSYGQVDVAVTFGGGNAHIGASGFNTGQARSFIAKLGVHTGGVVWFKPYGGTTLTSVTLRGLAVSPTDDIFTGGAYGGNVTLGAGGVTLPRGPNGFVARFWQ